MKKNSEINLKPSEIKKTLKDLLGDNRYEHCLEVSKMAVKLAKKYDADEYKAEIAGLLHDITKEISAEEQLKIILNSKIDLNEIEIHTKKLWHQISGMAYARDVLNVEDEDVLNAIRYHTSGRGGMSLLEKIIFVADYISNDRDYNGVKELRKLAEKNLEETMVECMAFTIDELVKEHRIIIEDTINAYNMAIMQKGKDD